MTRFEQGTVFNVFKKLRNKEVEKNELRDLIIISMPYAFLT